MLFFNISRLRLFNVCGIFVSKNYAQAITAKRFIISTILKLFTRFLHCVIMLPVFQTDIPACTIVRFRKLIYQALLENRNLYKLH